MNCIKFLFVKQDLPQSCLFPSRIWLPTLPGKIYHSAWRLCSLIEGNQFQRRFTAWAAARKVFIEMPFKMSCKQDDAFASRLFSHRTRFSSLFLWMQQLPVVTSSTIVRCRSCRTYINPFVSFLDQRRWKCNLCYRVNDGKEGEGGRWRRWQHLKELLSVSTLTRV